MEKLNTMTKHYAKHLLEHIAAHKSQFEWSVLELPKQIKFILMVNWMKI